MARKAHAILIFCLLATWSASARLPAGEGRTGGRDIALCVGVNGYRRLEPLTAPARDAAAVAAALEKTRAFRRIITLADSGPSASPATAPNNKNVTSALKLMANTATARDRIFVYFAGHGGDDGPGGARLHCLDDAGDQGIPLSEIISILSGSRSRAVFLVVDAWRGNPRAGDLADAFERADGAGMTLILPCSPGQVSNVDAEKGRSAFSLALESALSPDGDADADGFVSGWEIQDHLDVFLSDFCLEHLIDDGQVPEINEAGMDMAAIDLRVLLAGTTPRARAGADEPRAASAETEEAEEAPESDETGRDYFVRQLERLREKDEMVARAEAARARVADLEADRAATVQSIEQAHREEDLPAALKGLASYQLLAEAVEGYAPWRDEIAGWEKRLEALKVKLEADAAHRQMAQTGKTLFAAEDFDKAFPLLIKAAEYGVEEAGGYAGLCLYYGRGTWPDKVRAGAIALPAARAGFAAGQFVVGLVNDPLEGARASGADEAERWYRPAAEQGFAPAQLHLGLVLMHRNPGAEAAREALRWFLKAAAANNREAQYRIGLLYRDGAGVARDGRRALDWLTLAARRGHAEACRTMARIHLDGAGVPADRDQAARWLEKAAEHGLIEAMFELAELTRQGGLGVVDYAKARDFYAKAADRGHVGSMTALAKMHRNGEGGSSDYGMAAKYYRRAAQAGDADAGKELDDIYRSGHHTLDKAEVERHLLAQKPSTAKGAYDLAEMFADGRLVAQDMNKAIQWYRTAADAGLAEAQYSLAMIHYNGRGVPASKSQAVPWLRKAAEGGHAQAQNQLGVMYYKAEGGLAKNYGEAFRWCKRAADQGVAVAMYNVGRFYVDGEGTRVDLNQAHSYFLQGANQGHAGAMHELGHAYYAWPDWPYHSHAEALKWFRLAASKGESCDLSRELLGY